MSGLSPEDRRFYLEAIQRFGSAGRAEGASQQELAKGYLPIAEHLRMLDPDVVLIIGPRGSGKTEIVRILTEGTNFKALSRYAPAVRFPQGEATWIKAFPIGKAGFEPIGFRRFVDTSSDPRAMQELWFSYLIRVLADHLSDADRMSIQPLLSVEPSNPAAMHSCLSGLGTKVIEALDHLDSALEKSNSYIFTTYDELELLAVSDWSIIDAGVGSLMSFWATYARRWTRIRAKLFIRTDLYERNLKSGEADLAKLAAGRIELAWSDQGLYGLLLKRLCNSDPRLGDYIRGIRKIAWTEDAAFGYIPMMNSSQEAKPIVERLMGVYMGANAKKGMVFRWLLDHVRDGRGRAYPRPFVRLIEEAARLELMEMSSASRQKLLAPASIRRALDQVSQEHVTQSYSEWPWLVDIKTALAPNPLVPYAEKDLYKMIKALEGRTENSKPALDSRELIDYLLELGILRRRPENRYDVPDLFLAGMGLRRKGGVVKR